ncbi:hypothetical protein [Halomonas sp. CSM-2]|uniref:hypothetical protein n=1 Tax=Halomonas sp. CSM-2 TaxID=1975722 RepID=UPI00111C0D3E|nr:hypothetical protein [Halomonas sp. CSM-2]
MEELGLQSRVDVERAHGEGAFTRGHPDYFAGLTAHRRKCIIEWLNQPPEPAVTTYPTVETITLRLDAQPVHELEALANASKVESSELVARWIRCEAERKRI